MISQATVTNNAMAEPIIYDTLNEGTTIARMQAHISGFFESPYPSLNEDRLKGKILYRDDPPNTPDNIHFLLIQDC